MRISGFEFKHLTKEIVGADVENIESSKLFALVKKCITNDNIIFYNSTENYFGTCDLETYERFISGPNTAYWTVNNITNIDKEIIYDRFLVPGELKKQVEVETKEEEEKLDFEEWLSSESKGEAYKEYKRLYKEWDKAIVTIFIARKVHDIALRANRFKED